VEVEIMNLLRDLRSSGLWHRVALW